MQGVGRDMSLLESNGELESTSFNRGGVSAATHDSKPKFSYLVDDTLGCARLFLSEASDRSISCKIVQ